jgi:hypothetical protein
MFLHRFWQEFGRNAINVFSKSEFGLIEFQIPNKPSIDFEFKS